LKRDCCPVNRDASSSLKKLKEKGYHIILFTSRISAEREVTVKWLKKHDIPYDELVMDKPIAFIYIDDNAYRFRDWNTTLDDFLSRPELRREEERR